MSEEIEIYYQRIIDKENKVKRDIRNIIQGADKDA